MFEFTLRFVLPASLVAIMLTDSVGGMCGRIAIALPLAWCGVIDFDTAAAIADFHL